MKNILQGINLDILRINKYRKISHEICLMKSRYQPNEKAVNITMLNVHGQYSTVTEIVDFS